MVHSLLVEQAAELLGVSRRTVYYRIREGRLRTVRARCGSQRVLIESIEELLRERAARARNRASGEPAASGFANGGPLPTAHQASDSAMAAGTGGFSAPLNQS
jgi:excisionase family DNA binding protein